VLEVWRSRAVDRRGQGDAVTSDLDLLRSAKIVLDQHGPDALIHCARQADAMIERGDVRGYEVWCAILSLIESAKVHAKVSV
jgi:hypothetical protein